MKYLEVGKIVATHGIKGELKVSLTTSFPFERFQKGNVLYLYDDNNYQEIIIDSFRLHKEMGLVTFNNLVNINDVLKYVGKTIYVDKDTLEDLDDDNFYYDDLIGLKVKTTKDIEIGEVKDILEVPQGAILIIGKTMGEEALVPFVSEFIKDVDLKDGFITIEPIEGLI